MAATNTLRMFTVVVLLVTYLAGRIASRRNPSIKTFSVGYWIIGLFLVYIAPYLLGIITS